jgi:hypothetical protein
MNQGKKVAISVQLSPTSVWRVLSHAGLLSKWNGKPSEKGTDFEQRLAADQHWHIDVLYINILCFAFIRMHDTSPSPTLIRSHGHSEPEEAFWPTDRIEPRRFSNQ